MPTGIGRGFAWPALQAMLNYKGGQGFKDFSTAWRNPFTGVTMKPGTYTPDPNVAVIPPTYSNSPYAVFTQYNLPVTKPATPTPAQITTPAANATTSTPTTPSSPFRPQRYTPERDYQPFPLYNRISPFAR